MKISCNIIRDLLPLYADDMVSEDSRQLVKEHLKECRECSAMLEEMKKENQTAAFKESSSDFSRRDEIRPLKNIRRRIRRKRILSVVLTAALILTACGVGNYWYYDRKTYISWDKAGMTVRDGKVYSEVNPEGKLMSVLSVDQKSQFYMMNETMWSRKQYPSGEGTEYVVMNLKDSQEAHDRSADIGTDETSLPTGIENVYYVDPQYVKEAFALWDDPENTEEAAKKEKALAEKCTLIWTSEKRVVKSGEK